MDAPVPVFVEVFLEPIRDNQVAQVAIVAVLLLMLLDIVFGVGKALLQHNFSSEKMRQGIGHKCASLGFMIVAVIIDGTIVGGVDLGFSAPVLTTVCVYLCLMEIGSLLECFGSLNPELANSPVFKLLKSSHVLKDEEQDVSESIQKQLGEKPGAVDLDEEAER